MLCRNNKQYRHRFDSTNISWPTSAVHFTIPSTESLSLFLLGSRICPLQKIAFLVPLLHLEARDFACLLELGDSPLIY